MRTDRKLSVYESIVENIKRDIALGVIAEGERLPSCREMAMTLGINPNTVQRAYSALEEQGVIYTIPKKGVYCSANGRKADAQSNLTEAILSMKAAGISRREIEDTLDKIYGESDDD